MAINFYDEFVTPVTLTGYARQALRDQAQNQFALTAFLPDQNISDLQYKFAKGGGGLNDSASYRAFDAEPLFGSREGIAKSQGEIPPLGTQMVLGEYDTLRLRNAGPEIRELLLRDAEKCTRRISTRVEFARAQALVEAKVVMAGENGLFASVDFGRKPEHSVSAATAWSDLDSSNPIDDLEAWVTTYNDTNGRLPGAIITSTKVMRNLARNEHIRQEIYPDNSTRRLTLNDINDYFAALGFPPFAVYDAQAIDVAGVTRRFIPEDKLVMLPNNGQDGDPDTGSLGATLWGITAESLEPGYGIEAGSEPGIVVGAFKQVETPVRVFTIASAIALPVVVNPDLTFVADVL